MAEGTYNPRVDVNIQMQWICGKVFAKEKKILYLKQQYENKPSPLTKSKALHTARKYLWSWSDVSDLASTCQLFQEDPSLIHAPT